MSRCGNPQENSEEELRQLYRELWQICGGWNRVPFRAKHIHYIMQLGVTVSLAPLGKLDGIAMIIDGEPFIGLNRAICPETGHRGIEFLTPGVWESINRRLGNRARFVLLHELAHIMIHRDEPQFWKRRPAAGRDTHSVWEHDIVRRDRTSLEKMVNATLREVEADFFALLALLPDYRLFIMDRGQRLEPGEVVRALCEDRAIPLEDKAQLWGLAEYRIAVYRKFAHLFRVVSIEPFVQRKNGKPFRNVATIDEVDAETLQERNAPYVSGTVKDIALEHPRVKADQLIARAIEEGNYKPFASFTSGKHRERAVASS
jgi:hypothetical protein